MNSWRRSAYPSGLADEWSVPQNLDRTNWSTLSVFFIYDWWGDSDRWPAKYFTGGRWDESDDATVSKFNLFPQRKSSSFGRFPDGLQRLTPFLPGPVHGEDIHESQVIPAARAVENMDSVCHVREESPVFSRPHLGYSNVKRVATKFLHIRHGNGTNLSISNCASRVLHPMV